MSANQPAKQPANQQAQEHSELHAHAATLQAKNFASAQRTAKPLTRWCADWLMALGFVAASLSSQPAQAASAQILGITCTDQVGQCSDAVDGFFPAEGTYFMTNATDWFSINEPVGAPTYLIFQLAQTYTLGGFTASMDHNDSYWLDVSTNGSDWTFWGQTLPEIGEVAYGLDTLSTDPQHPEYEAGLDQIFNNVSASWVRLRGAYGDGLYGIGEVVFLQGTPVNAPVPEPSSAALLALGGTYLLRRRARSGAAKAPSPASNNAALPGSGTA